MEKSYNLDSTLHIKEPAAPSTHIEYRINCAVPAELPDKQLKRFSDYNDFWEDQPVHRLRCKNLMSIFDTFRTGYKLIVYGGWQKFISAKHRDLTLKDCRSALTHSCDTLANRLMEDTDRYLHNLDALNKPPHFRSFDYQGRDLLIADLISCGLIHSVPDPTSDQLKARHGLGRLTKSALGFDPSKHTWMTLDEVRSCEQLEIGGRMLHSLHSWLLELRELDIDLQEVEVEDVKEEL